MSTVAEDVQELNEKGYIKTSPRLLYYIRTNNMFDIKFFRPGVARSSGSKGSSEYSSIDIFGEYCVYCYDIGHIKEFVDFLVSKFFSVNENPDDSIRKAFTRILHSNGLHWKGCCCREKK